MSLPNNIKDREYDKFTENSDNNTAVRVVITEPKPDDAPGPTNLTLSSASVKENLPAGTVIGNLTVSGGTAPITFTIDQDLNNYFQIVGNELQTSQPIDFATSPTANVAVRATDNNGKFTTANFLITIIETGGFVNNHSYELSGNGYLNTTSSYILYTKSWWAWVRIPQQQSATQTILDSRQGTLQQGVYLAILDANSTHDIELNVRTVNNARKRYQYDFPSNWKSNGWNLIGFSFQANSLELYVNGAFTPPDLIVNNATTTTLPTATSTTFGADNTFTGGFVTGLIDEIGRSGSVINTLIWAQLYNNGVAPNLTDVFAGFSATLINWYRAEDFDGNPDPLPLVPDRQSTADAVANNVVISNDASRAYQNIVSTEFDGTTNYFVGNGANTIDWTDPVTFVFWLDRTSTASTEAIISNRASISTNNAWSIYFDNNNSNRLNFEMESTGNNDLRTRHTVGASFTGQFAQYVLVIPSNLGSFDGNNIDLYVNGVLTSKTVQANTLATIPTLSNSLSIGANTTGNNKLDGLVNEVTVIQKELSTTEIQEAYNLGVPFNLIDSSFGNDIVQRWRMGNNNNFGATMTDDIGGEQMIMINYDPAFYVGITP